MYADRPRRGSLHLSLVIDSLCLFSQDLVFLKDVPYSKLRYQFGILNDGGQGIVSVLFASRIAQARVEPTKASPQDARREIAHLFDIESIESDLGRKENCNFSATSSSTFFFVRSHRPSVRNVSTKSLCIAAL